MNCREFERILIEQDPSATLPLEAEDHLKTCSECHQLAHALAMTPGGGTGISPALERLAMDLATNLSTVKPLAPAGYFVMAFLGVFALIVAFGVHREGTLGLIAMNRAQSVSILSMLVLCTWLLIWSLVRQMVPGSRHGFRPEILTASTMGILTLLAILLFRLEDETHFWPRNWFCIRMGLSFALLATGPFCLLIWRGAVLSPRIAGATTGLLAGLAGMTVVEIHCPILDLAHILISHVGVPLLGGIFGLVTVELGQIVVPHLRLTAGSHGLRSRR